MGGVGSSSVGLNTWKALSPGTTGKGPVFGGADAAGGVGGVYFWFGGAGVFPSSLRCSVAFAGVFAGLSIFCGRSLVTLSCIVLVSRSPK